MFILLLTLFWNVAICEAQACNSTSRIDCAGYRLYCHDPPACSNHELICRDSKCSGVHPIFKTPAPIPRCAASVCKHILCYVSFKRLVPGLEHPSVEHLPSLCTHFVFLDIYISTDGSSIITLPGSTRLLQRLMELKSTHPHIKILVRVGGWKFIHFSAIASTMSSRSVLIRTTIEYLREHNLDGAIVDWEWPVIRKRGSPEDKPNLSFLLKEFKEAFKKHRYTLSSTLANFDNAADINQCYDVTEIFKHVDFIIIFPYKIWGSNRRTRWKIYYSWNETYYSSNSPNLTVWIENGAQMSKIVLSILGHGRQWQVQNLDPFRKVSGAYPGPYTNDQAFMSYYEVCNRLSGFVDSWGAWVTKDPGPFIRVGRLWISYDNPLSIAGKVRYVHNHGLAGIGMYNTFLDDYTGKFCNEGTYPLLRAINEACTRMLMA